MNERIVPFWALSSGNGANAVPNELFGGAEGGFTPERVRRLRAVLTSYADEPAVVMERHPIDVSRVENVGGRVLASTSPLVERLRDIVGETTKVTASESAAGATGVLYRMVLPKDVAAQVLHGAARPMSAGGDAGAIYGSILGKAGIVANAKFVPVAAQGAGATAGSGAAVAATGATVVAAAPVLVLLAATAASIYAEEQRRRALERLQTSLDELQAETLDKERDELNGAVGAISKATAVLADEGRLGASLGIDAATHAVDTAVSRAERRLQAWESALSKLGATVTPETLRKTFPGIESRHGEFRAKLEMAAFALSMKRRLVILQAAEHTRLNDGLALRRFTKELAKDSEALDELERRFTELVADISRLGLQAPDRRRNVLFRPGEVNNLLQWGPRLRQLADDTALRPLGASDVEVSLVVEDDGDVRILAPVALGS